MAFLKQSTTVTVQVGPFLDATDGVTAETALTPGIEVSKAGAAFGARNSATAVAHDAEGWYRVELDGTDTNTLGRLVVKAHDSATHVPVWHEFEVLPANVYDSVVAGSDQLQVDAIQISGDATAADNLELDYDGTGYAKANSTIGTCTTNTDMLTTAAILAAGDIDTYSLEEALKLCLAALAGKLSGAATTTVTIRAADDSKARVTATVDADGNRSAITLDATG